MSQTNPQVLPNERISNVASEISRALQGIVAKGDSRRDARDLYQTASNDAGNARENVLVTLSEIAAREHWSLYEIDNGTDKALSQRNDSKDNSIKTFANELKRACHPSARQHVRAFSELATTVWDSETAQDKKLPRPLRGAFVRKYHLLQRMISEAIDSKHIITTSRDVISFALEHDPKHNPERMFKKFKTIRDSLRELADDCPLDEIINASESVRDLTLADFKHPDQHTAGKSAVKAPARPTGAINEDPGATNEDPKGNATYEDHDEPEVNVNDLLDEALKDMPS